MFTQYKDPVEQKNAQKAYLLDLVAKMYLNGKSESDHLKDVKMFIADQDNYCYQTYTKTGIANRV